MSRKGFGFRTLNYSLLILLLFLSINSFNPHAVYGASNATVSVDASNEQGTLFRAEQYNNVLDYDRYVDQRDSDVQFYNEQDLHAKVFRVWVHEKDVYDINTGTYDYSKYTDYLSDISKAADTLMLNIHGDKMFTEWHYSPSQWKPIFKKMVKDLKQSYPKMKYIEVLNEPDWISGFTADDYYGYYKVSYEAINEINAELHPEIPLKVGGSSLSQFNLTWLRAFLDGYVNDGSYNKKLDFISYHAYYRNDGSGWFFYKSDPSVAGNERAQLDNELSSRGLSTSIPVYITETGMYPYTLFDDPNSIQTDSLRQAAGVASLLYWYTYNNNKTYPFQWALRMDNNGRKSQLVTHDAQNNPMVFENKFTPVGNMIKMWSMMKKTKISASSNVINGGKGVYTIASKDSSGVSLMLWNYQATGTDDFNTTVNVTNLPSSFNDKNLRVKTYKINATTSNYFTNLDNSNLQMVDDKIDGHNGTYNTSLTLESNSLQLVVLEPVNKKVLLTNMFDEEVTGANPGWTVNEPIDTAVSIANVPNTVNRSVYLNDNSTTNYAEISKTFSSHTGTVVAEWLFKERTSLAGERFQLRSGTTVTADVYVNDSGYLQANGFAIQPLSLDTWYTVKLLANPEEDKYDIYVNGILKKKAISFASAVSSLDNINIRTGEAVKNSLYVDYVQINAQN
ncbi:MAG: hypothetical protein K0S39_5647 [Paenibacillus sp.]|nr:hypothetical protein [Paenibacillus sp.]